MSVEVGTRYADSEGVSIAYQVHGEGPLDLVFVSGFVSHTELFWDEPVPARIFRRLASFSRLIMFDKRGQGLSDRLGRAPTLEESMSDVRAVMDAVGSERAALVGISEGGPMCELFAAAHPERTAALVLYGTYARLTRAPDYPQGVPEEVMAQWGERVRREWGGPVGIELWAPSAATDPAFRDWWARLLRQGTSPRGAVELMALYRDLDARPALAAIRVPTLVLHRADDRLLPAAHGRYLADHIPGARYVELPGEDHLPMAGDSDAILDEIEEFLVGTRRTHGTERVLATVLFTDIVGSTERAAALGDRRWRDLLAAHDAVVRQHLRLHGGTEIKTMGDGFLATFDGPARAIRAAREMRERARALGVEIRVGIHTGEVAVTGGDVAGMGVNIGARVGALAGAGEVLVSSTVKELVVGSEFDFVDRGAHTLKGVPGEWRLYAVAGVAGGANGANGANERDAPAADDRGTAPAASVVPPLPPALAAAGEGPLVGRGAELEALRAAWREARAGSPRVVLLAGEPGIGKTRSAAELARQVRAAGAPVLYGRCDRPPIGPYQPFVEALDRVVADRGLDPRALAPAHAAELGGLLPGLAAGAGPAASADPDPDAARFRVFGALWAALAAAMDGRPALLVLDDLHWADEPTGSLLLHVVRSARTEPLAVLGTYRDTAVDGTGHPLAAVLAELRRRPDVRELSLPPLDEDDVGELVEQAGMDGAERELPALVRARTGGNPLFVVEVLRDLAERRGGDGVDGELPTVVRDVIEGRLARLGEDAVAMLRVAAVAGEQFELADLEAAGDLDPPAALGAIERALGARLVRELPGVPGRYAFAHALVREVLNATTSAARRARLDARLGAAQAARGAPAAAVAGHLLDAAPLGDPEVAVEWAERAAAAAAAAAAHEDASDLLRRALDRLALPKARRARLLVDLGRALDRGARRVEAREAFEAAAGLARELGDPSLLAVAALGHKGLGVTIADADRRTVALLEEALAAGDGLEPGLRARACAALGLELYYSDGGRSQQLSARALDLARQSGERTALAEALSARHASLWTPAGAEERLAVATEMRELARSGDEPIAGLQARNWRVLDLLELGRIDEVEREVDEYEREAAPLRLPRFAWYVPLWRAALAMLRGDFELAEEHSRAAAELGLRSQDANAETYELLQRMHLSLERRRFDRIDLETVRELVARSPSQRNAWLGWLAWVHAERGEPAPAREALAEVAADDFSALPREANWHAMCETAEACAVLGAVEHAPRLLELLEPHGGLNVVVGRGIGCYGPVAYCLGRLRATSGDHEEAVREFETSLAICERMGARPRAALSRLRLGEALCVLGDHGRGGAESEKARRELDEMGVRP